MVKLRLCFDSCFKTLSKMNVTCSRSCVYDRPEAKDPILYAKTMVYQQSNVLTFWFLCSVCIQDVDVVLNHLHCNIYYPNPSFCVRLFIIVTKFYGSNSLTPRTIFFDYTNIKLKYWNTTIILRVNSGYTNCSYITKKSTSK